METIAGVRQTANPELALEGILRTMYDPRNGLTRDVSRQLINHFGEDVFRTVIPRNIRLAEAPSHGEPVLYYDRQSRGSVAYQALAGELRRKHQRSAEQTQASSPADSAGTPNIPSTPGPVSS